MAIVVEMINKPTEETKRAIDLSRLDNAGCAIPVSRLMEVAQMNSGSFKADRLSAISILETECQQDNG